MTVAAFIFFTVSVLSVWYTHTTLVWGGLAALSVIFGVLGGLIDWVGLAFIGSLALLWFVYSRKAHVVVFIAIVALSTCFKLKLLPGFSPVFITPKFAMGLENPFVGLFPLALLVPLATDCKGIFKGMVLAILGVGVIAIAAVSSGAITLNFSFPPFILARTFSNLVLTSIPEEAFYRGFVQNTLCTYFRNSKTAKVLALLLTSILFSATHIFWAPNMAILGFTFLASLLYGSIYLYTQKIECAMFCHFLLNFVHMTCFSYHAV